MSKKDLSKWNEFDWENELRLDDARIHAYISELPRYIDLPREDELLLKRMQRNTELIPQNINWNDTPYNAIFESEEFDDDFFNADDWKERDGADIYVVFQKLACEWGEIFAELLGKKHMEQGIIIVTLYGKISARLADIIDLNAATYNPLRIALAKRVINELNNLIGALSDLENRNSKLKNRIKNQLAHIQILREKMVDLLYKFRKNAKNV